MARSSVWDQQLDAMSRHRDGKRVLPRPQMSAKVLRDRSKREKDAPSWLRYYFPRIFRLPFGSVHEEIIEAVEYTITTGGRCAVAAPRGTGKSYILDGCALLAVVRGQCRFPVVIPWDSKGLKKALSFWVKALCFNDKFTHDYLDLCAPFKECRGSSQRCMTFSDEDGCAYGARLVVSEGLIVLPDSRGVIGGSTINGNPLGLHHTTDKGEGLRPDCILIDDPQDAETALSRPQIQSTIDLIDKDISGMSGPDTPMPMMMACTVKQPQDVAEHYLDGKSGWKAVRVGQITSWPSNTVLWEEWFKAYQAGEENKDGGKAGLSFYAKNKDALVKDMSVSWEHRFNKDQPDALYSAMFDYYRMGRPAFMAERQNEPVDSIATQYELTVPMILAHAITMPRLEIPSSSTVFVGSIDINRVGLHFVFASFDQQMTAHVPMYGRWPGQGNELWPKNAPELVRKQAIFRGLKELCDALAKTVFMRNGQRIRLGTLLVDRGYEPDVVHKFCQSSVYPFRLVPSRGYAAHKYWPRKNLVIGRPFEGCHLTKSENGNFLAFNADVWRETSQRAFLCDAGAPGGITLHATDHDKQHTRFAEHITAEKLTNKYETDGGPRWEWRHQPGNQWDWGDCLTGCYVAAAANGLSASGMTVVRKKYIETRKSKVIAEN